MTKIRNTKKGMAKKTLSISLAVAMLATSNVPVWAAEFTDGSAVEFTSEAPVEVVEETPVAEVEAPVIEETEAPVAQEVHGYTSNIALKENGNGWAGDIVLKEDVVVKAADGKVVDNANYKWTIRKDGYEVMESWTDGDGADLTVGGFKIPLSHADYGHVYDVVLEVTLPNEEPIFLYSNAVTVSAVDLNKLAPEATLNLDARDTQYTGAEIKIAASGINADGKGGSITVDWTSNETKTLTKDDFALTYSGDLVNVTDQNIEVRAVVAKADGVTPDPAFYGSIKADYKIVPRSLTKNSVKAEFVNPDMVFEYTGYNHKFTNNDLKLTVTDANVVANKDITSIIKECVGGVSTFNIGTSVGLITIDPTKLSKNFAWNDDTSLSTVNTYKVIKRDFSKLTANVGRSFSLNELRGDKGVFAGKVKDTITFTDSTGAEVKLNPVIFNIGIDANVANVDKAGTYEDAVTVFGADTAVTEKTTKTDLVIRDRSIAEGNFTLMNEAAFKATHAKFAGEGVEVKLDRTKFGHFAIGAATLIEGTDYEIVYANNTKAGTANVIVKGLGRDYAGTEKVYEFQIDPAPIVKAETDKKELVYNASYTSVADYLKDLSLTVTADNESTTTISTDRFTLKDTEYTITNLDALKAAKNELNKDGEIKFFINVEAVKNAKGEYCGNYSGTEKTVEITVCRKSLSSEDVKVTVEPDSYVYTGSEIVPEKIVVTDGDKVLEEGTDYIINRSVLSNQAVNAGTAKVTVVAPEGSPYKKGSTATGTFTITPASIDDVKLEVTGDVEYDGTKKDAEDVTVKVTLGKVDVTKDFNVSFPTSRYANINAGKDAGKLTLTAKADKAKNYTAAVKDATFEITPAPLNGDLKVYDKVGRELDKLEVTYNGSFQTFGGEKFFEKVGTPVTNDDYEIVYADNCYGKAYAEGKQYGAILAVAKGNYKGTLNETTTNGDIINGVYTDAAGNKIENVVAVKWMLINRVELAASNITVENGVYAGGYTVKPNVVVKYNGKALVEGKDYVLDLSKNTGKNMIDATTAKSLDVTVTPINGYVSTGNPKAYEFHWGIDKFDLANANVEVSGTDAAPVVKVMNGSVLVGAENYTVEVAEGKVTVTATKDNKNYTGSKTEDIKHALEKPEAPMIARVDVVGNKATVILSGESDGAIGYDYVIGAKDCIETKDYVKVNKNKLTTDTTFTYTQQGQYYAYCHAWTRDENGKKVFSDWSNGMPFMVSAVTPDTPVITGYKVKGNTVTVTYTKAVNATGYDVVLGSEYATVADEKRPVNYGELVEKNIKGNTVTATFKNVPAGTYYAGLHAFNRTSEDGKKVFSPWSNIKTIKVK